MPATRRTFATSKACRAIVSCKGDICDPAAVRDGDRRRRRCDRQFRGRNARRSVDPGSRSVSADRHARDARAARGGARARDSAFLQVSTDEVYGDVAQGESRESDPLLRAARTPRAKPAPTCRCSPTRDLRTPVLITRGSNTYGPNQYPGEDHPALRHQPDRR